MQYQVLFTVLTLFFLCSCRQGRNAENSFQDSDLNAVRNELEVTWYVWYTKVYGRSPGYWGTIWYATSTDEGLTWQEEGEALGVGTKGNFDSQATFTPNILSADGKYYLFYTGVKPTPGRTDGVFENNSTNDITAIGVAESDSPNGPFRRLHKGEPVLEISSGKNDFDSYRIDDAVLLVRDGKYWLYYKGRSIQHGREGPGKTKMGVAFADRPEGPCIKYERNPILDRSHEVMIWKQGKGIGCLASISSTLEYAYDGLDFMTAALHIEIPEEDRPKAPGTFRPDLVDRDAKNSGLTWGISMVHNGDEAYLIRWKLWINKFMPNGLQGVQCIKYGKYKKEYG